MSTLGIHHITAISSNAQKTFDFYTNVLGLRLVKKTVNFDSPDTYHLYFGDEIGTPGTIITFFPFPRAGTGMRGRGQITKIYFSIPTSSLGYWISRFVTKGIKHESIRNRFEMLDGKKIEKYVTFFDPDGLQLELVGVSDEEIKTTEEHTSTWQDSPVPVEHAIRSFYGAELSVESIESIEHLLTEVLGYENTNLVHNEFLYRFENTNTEYAKIIDILTMRGWPEGVVSAGTNHHIAFRVKNKESQLKLREEIITAGFHATEVVDRNYFESVYFRERNGILFEIATDPPGFLIDETKSKLGSSLKLPQQFEVQRDLIERGLPDLYTEQNQHSINSNVDQLNLFKHKFIDNKSSETFVVLHGTGGNEEQMINFVESLGLRANILSVRGNISENGRNRFFKRITEDQFDMESIKVEAKKFNDFLNESFMHYELGEQPISFLGYSNGANFALAYAFLYPMTIENIFALHPMVPLSKVESDLSETKVFITYGKDDFYSTETAMEKLKRLIESAKGRLTTKKFDGGHEIGPEEIHFLKHQLQKNSNISQ